jgi:hypothetical protein
MAIFFVSSGLRPASALFLSKIYPLVAGETAPDIGENKDFKLLVLKFMYFDRTMSLPNCNSSSLGMFDNLSQQIKGLVVGFQDSFHFG